MKIIYLGQAISENQEQLTFEGDPIKLARKIILQKYADAFCWGHEDVVNSILKNEKVPFVTLYKDYIYYDDESEYLKRYYSMLESERKLQYILQLYETELKPSLILHIQNTILAQRYKNGNQKLDFQQLAESPKGACDELHSLNFEHEIDLGPLNSFSNEKELFGGDSDDTEGEEGTEPKMFASVLDDGQVHNSFQKLLEKYEEMDNMSFESNQYNIYSPDKSTQNSPKKSTSPLRATHSLIKDIEENKNLELDFLIEDFKLEAESNSEEQRAKVNEVKDYFESEEFEIHHDDFDIVSGSPHEELIEEDIVQIVKKQSSTNKSTNETKDIINKSKTSPPSISNLKTQPSLPDRKELFAKKTSVETIYSKHKSPTLPKKPEHKPSLPKTQVISELENFKKQLKNIESAVSGKHSSPKQGPYFLSMKKSPGSENANSESTLHSKYQNQSARRELSYMNTVEDNQVSKSKLLNAFYTLRSTQASPNPKGIVNFYKEKYIKTDQNEKSHKLFNKTNGHIQDKQSIYLDQGRKSSLETSKKSFIASNIFEKLSGQKNKVLETQKKMKEICSHAPPQTKTKKKNVRSTQVNSLTTQESDGKNYHLTQNLKTENFASNSLLRIAELSSSLKEAFFKNSKTKTDQSETQSNFYTYQTCSSPVSKPKNYTANSSLTLKIPYSSNANNIKETNSLLARSNYRSLTSKAQTSNTQEYSPLGHSNLLMNGKGSRSNSRKKSKKKKACSKSKASIDGNQANKKSFEFKLDLATLNKMIANNPPGSKTKANAGFFSSKIPTNIETINDIRTSSNRYSKVHSENRQKSAKLKGSHH